MLPSRVEEAHIQALGADERKHKLNLDLIDVQELNGIFVKVVKLKIALKCQVEKGDFW